MGCELFPPTGLGLFLLECASGEVTLGFSNGISLGIELRFKRGIVVGSNVGCREGSWLGRSLSSELGTLLGARGDVTLDFGAWHPRAAIRN